MTLQEQDEILRAQRSVQRARRKLGKTERALRETLARVGFSPSELAASVRVRDCRRLSVRYDDARMEFHLPERTSAVKITLAIFQEGRLYLRGEVNAAGSQTFYVL